MHKHTHAHTRRAARRSRVQRETARAKRGCSGGAEALHAGRGSASRRRRERRRRRPQSSVGCRGGETRLSRLPPTYPRLPPRRVHPTRVRTRAHDSAAAAHVRLPCGVLVAPAAALRCCVSYIVIPWPYVLVLELLIRGCPWRLSLSRAVSVVLHPLDRRDGTVIPKGAGVVACPVKVR